MQEDTARKWHRAIALALTTVVSIAFLLGVPLETSAQSSSSGSFADNPIVYFAITDRFVNGNPANDHSYGRHREPFPADDVGTFHGGDLAGLTRKLDEGWFKSLGVNAIWITAPYEQIHGWVVGGHKEFKHYAYHGYYALDYTKLDANMGTEAELQRFVSAAHAQKIRVLFDVVMNHPGYGDLTTLSEYVRQPADDKVVGVVRQGFEAANVRDYHSHVDYGTSAWLNWWGPDWVRARLPGYTDGGGDDLTRQLAYLPDFKTESAKPVDLPPLLKAKPDTNAVSLPATTVRGYLVNWLTRWVRDFGIDGFRCDTVKHVEYASWQALKASASQALSEWKLTHPGEKIDDAPFWMTGEFWGHGIGRTRLYDVGFDNMINFDFQERASRVAGPADLDRLFGDYAKVLAAPATHNVMSYLSSHDTRLFDRKKLFEGANALLLAPGGVQIFYGDESARPTGPAVSGDPQQGTRSDMNWDSVDTALLAHWQKLGQFRARHVAIARGKHTRLDANGGNAPYVFSRVTANDRVVIALGARGRIQVPVKGVFEDGMSLRDAYGATTALVSGGEVTIDAEAPGGVVLLEEADR